MNYIEIQNHTIKQFNVTIVENSTCWSRMHAHCNDGSRRICKWDQVNSYKSLWDLLHEIGHLETLKNGMTRAEEETEAVRWTINYLRENGLKVKRRYLNGYKRYVSRCYERALRRGLKRRIKCKLLLAKSSKN